MGQGLDASAAAALGRVQAAQAAVRAEEHELFRAVAQLEGDGVAVAAGYRSTKRLLQDALRVNAAEAGRLLDRARDLTARVAMSGEPLPPALPATAEASAAGLLGARHLAVITATMTHLDRVPGIDPEALRAAEQALVQCAGTLAPAGLQKVAHRLVASFDPDGAAPPEPAEPDDEMHLVRRRDGSLVFKGQVLGPADAETIVEVFDALATPAGPDDPRTQPQRFAEALKELVAQAVSPTGIATDARRGETDDVSNDDEATDTGSDTGTDATPTGRCPTVSVNGRALLAVTIEHRWLQRSVGHGLLDSDRAVDTATARRLACDAGVVPVVLGSRSAPLDVGRLSYTVPEALRRALHLRDGGCSFPGCTRRPKRCHAHHLRHWADGGETTLENLTLLCSYHHHLVHHGDWTVTMIDGRPWYRPPSWVDPERRPRPGGRFPVPDSVA